jgi:sugar phosphate isomerase/epimerase
MAKASRGGVHWLRNKIPTTPCHRVGQLHAADMTWSAHLYPYAKHPDGVPAPEDLTALAAAGYTGVEGFVDQIGLRLPELQACGLAVTGLHVTSGALVTELDATRKALEATNCPTLIVSGPLGWNDRSRENWLATIAVLASAAKHIAADGRRLLYHNHEFEFQTTEAGLCAYDLLAPGLADSAAAWCCDLGWVWRAGVDPLLVLTRLGTQIEAVHLRDFTASVACALGAGEAPVMDWLAALPNDLRWRVVEADPTPLATELLVSSQALLKRFDV